jgi:hypothetical protein
MRVPPRWADPKAVARLAKAAVNHGADACAVVAEVARAVECQRCAAEADRLREADRILGLRVNDMNEAFLSLLEAITGIDLKGNELDRGFWDKVLRKLRRIIFIADVVKATITLVAAFDAFNAALIEQRRAIVDILACLEGE